MELTSDQDRAIQTIGNWHPGRTIRISPRAPIGELSILADVMPEGADDETVNYVKRYRVLANGRTFGVAE